MSNMFIVFYHNLIFVRNSGFNVFNGHVMAVVMFKFLFYFSFLSVWLIVCITVENFIVTFYLSKAVVFCTVFRAKCVIAVLVLYSTLLYSGQIWTTGAVEVYENYTMCTEKNEYAQINRIYSFWDTFTTMLLPILITSVLIVAILTRNLCRARRIDGHDNSIYTRLSKKQKCLVRITRVLLAISLTFVILSGPSHFNKLRHLIMSEINGGQLPYTLSDRVLQQVFQMIYYLSSCFNIVYYLIWSHNFRKEMRRLFCIKAVKNERSNGNVELREQARVTLDKKNSEAHQHNGYNTIVDRSTNLKSQVTNL